MTVAPYEHQPQNFLGLEPALSDPATARSLILPIPYDHTASFGSGARNGPAAIIAASRELEHYDVNRDCVAHLSGIATLPPLEPEAAGPEQMTDKIRAAAAALLDPQRFVIGLGGDHSVSVGLARAHAERWPDISFLHLDAHADLRLEYQGSRYSHACTARWLSELGPVLQLGIRSADQDELRAPKPHPVVTRRSREVLAGRDWAADIRGLLTDNVYLTVDVDVLDPAIMPSTGTPEPGGLGYHLVLDIFEELFGCRRVVGMDIVELSPLQDLRGPDVICAHLVQTAVGLRWPAAGGNG